MLEPYQQEYLENCKLIRTLAASSYRENEYESVPEDERELSSRNMVLLKDNLLPVLDELYQQSPEVVAALEEFAGELTRGPKALDVPLACQLHEALVEYARRSGRREYLIRELYNLGMARYGLWSMITGMNTRESSSFTMRMRYCFVEAASYIRYFDEFDIETKGYILRATANIYLGSFENWRDKLECVRHSMRVFTDEQYRNSAPDLPWNRYMSLLHQQMIGVVPHTFAEGGLTPDEIADVMESAHIIYESQLEQARKNGTELRMQNFFSYYSLEFRCGLLPKEEFIRTVEQMMDEADVTKYDSNNAYRIVGLPAFYAQYLRLMPDMIPPRSSYIASLYRRILEYVDKLSPEDTSDQVVLFARQALTTYVEVEDGVYYRDFATALLRRFSPELYSHGVEVGLVARELCSAMLSDEGGCFDDIPELKGLSGDKRRDAALDLAYYSGVLHDIGKINFTSVYNHAGRQMLSSEDELLQLHTIAGRIYLDYNDSTVCCGQAAFGHHRYYDSSGGFPADYRRMESPYRSIVDIIALSDFLTDGDAEHPPSECTLDDRIAAALTAEGRRFSPLVTAWLRTPALVEKLKKL